MAVVYLTLSVRIEAAKLIVSAGGRPIIFKNEGQCVHLARSRWKVSLVPDVYLLAVEATDLQSLKAFIIQVVIQLRFAGLCGVCGIAKDDRIAELQTFDL